MTVAPSTRSHLDDHLGQAEFALKIALNFDCLKGAPAHESVREALSRVTEARVWVRKALAVHPAAIVPAELPGISPAERQRTISRRMARLVP